MLNSRRTSHNMLHRKPTFLLTRNGSLIMGISNRFNPYINSSRKLCTNQHMVNCHHVVKRHHMANPCMVNRHHRHHITHNNPTRTNHGRHTTRSNPMRINHLWTRSNRRPMCRSNQ